MIKLSVNRENWWIALIDPPVSDQSSQGNTGQPVIYSDFLFEVQAWGYFICDISYEISHMKYP
jgi:hypothetical protein